MIGYVNKNRLASMQLVPVPKDLENWIEVEHDPDFDYMNKIYDPQSGTFVPDIARIAKSILVSRAKAYKEESDGLFIEWQYDQTPEAEEKWRAKVSEIKARFPI